jgi:hypothetical protein
VGLHHPSVVHDGTATAIRDDRQQVLDAAYAAHPERFTRPPTAPRLPAHAWINKPEIRNEIRPTTPTWHVPGAVGPVGFDAPDVLITQRRGANLRSIVAFDQTHLRAGTPR